MLLIDLLSRKANLVNATEIQYSNIVVDISVSSVSDMCAVSGIISEIAATNINCAEDVPSYWKKK
jgi:hypothetical protein